MICQAYKSAPTEMRHCELILYTGEIMFSFSMLCLMHKGNKDVWREAKFRHGAIHRLPCRCRCIIKLCADFPLGLFTSRRVAIRINKEDRLTFLERHSMNLVWTFCTIHTRGSDSWHMANIHTDTLLKKWEGGWAQHFLSVCLYTIRGGVSLEPSYSSTTTPFYLHFDQL